MVQGLPGKAALAPGMYVMRSIGEPAVPAAGGTRTGKCGT